MYNLFGDDTPYEGRKVARYEGGKGFYISTALNVDDPPFYETAVAHPEYHESKVIVVEEYKTEKDAKKGHDKWIEIMTIKNLPDSLKSISTCEFAMAHFQSMDDPERTYKRQQ